ncbi:MAG: transglutaminase domain-containing protein, partial [Thermoplasmata archaeon]|nr:transglutaminase domain-containing protein [Thermoplasmata archaeon]
MSQDGMADKGVVSEEGTSVLEDVKAYAIQTLIDLEDLKAAYTSFQAESEEFKDMLAGIKADKNSPLADDAYSDYLTALKAVESRIDDLLVESLELEEAVVPCIVRPSAVVVETEEPIFGEYRGVLPIFDEFREDIIDTMDAIYDATVVRPVEMPSLKPLSHHTIDLDGGSNPASSPDVSITGEPGDDDLLETEDAWISEYVGQKANSMDMEKLYRWVLEGVDYEPYLGSLKGSDQTLMQRTGNDVDQASLLIAMLRERDVPARYVYGTIQAPGNDVADWLMADTPGNAAQILRGSGIPAKVQGGDVIFEHYWVAACIDDEWVELDPSWSPEEFEEIDNLTVMDGITYFNGTYGTVEENGEPDLTGPTSLPSELSYTVVTRMGWYAELPEDLRHTVTIELQDGEENTEFTYSGFAGRLASG